MKQPQPYEAANDATADVACAADTPDNRQSAGRPFAHANAAQASVLGGATPVEGWSQIADCEARNALQVILSGSEILLEDFFGRLLPEQKLMLEKILASAHRLNIIIATLTRPDDLVGGPVSGAFSLRQINATTVRIRKSAEESVE